jgi:hypothetical protein
MAGVQKPLCLIEALPSAARCEPLMEALVAPTAHP